MPATQVGLDFSDLESVTLAALADLPKLQAIADEGYRRVVSTTEKTMARDVAEMLHKVIK